MSEHGLNDDEETGWECCDFPLPKKDSTCPCGCHYDSEEAVNQANVEYLRQCNEAGWNDPVKLDLPSEPKAAGKEESKPE
jgi:hypothetical protein